MDPVKAYWVLVGFGCWLAVLSLVGIFMWQSWSTLNKLFDLMHTLPDSEKDALNWPVQHPFAFYQSGEGMSVRAIPKKLRLYGLFWRIFCFGLPRKGTPTGARPLVRKLRLLALFGNLVPLGLFVGAVWVMNIWVMIR